MAGLLGDGWEDPRSAAMMALAGGLLQGNFGAGLLGANQAYGDSKAGALKAKLLQAQVAETEAQAQERAFNAKKQQAALEQAARLQAGIPGLFRQPGMTGGEPQPQTEGGIPMFSRPMGVGPMRSTPGGFDVDGAIRLGMDPKMIEAYAGLQNVGRPKATRQMEVDDGKGGKRIALVDDFGQEVAGFAGYTAPVQVDTGKGTSFVKPMPGLDVAKVPTFGDDTARRGQDLSYASTIRGQNMTDARSREANNAGKVPAGYRMKMDGTLEAIPGGPAALGKALPTKILGDLTDQAQVADNTERFVRTFDSKYGNKTVVGEASNVAKRVFGDDTGQAQWWQDYGLHEAQARNKLFGASLTPGEQAAWTKLAVTPRMDSEQIKANLQRRAEIEQTGLDRLTNGAVAGGYNKEQIEAVTGRPIGAKPPANKPSAPPMRGQVVDGYRFKGGNPADPKNWEPK